MFYNLDQFNSDLRMIARVYGERRQRGFYAQQEYQCGDYTIVDPFIAEPYITVCGDTVAKHGIKMTSAVAEFVLNKAISVEENEHWHFLVAKV